MDPNTYSPGQAQMQEDLLSSTRRMERLLDGVVEYASNVENAKHINNSVFSLTALGEFRKFIDGPAAKQDFLDTFNKGMPTNTRACIGRPGLEIPTSTTYNVLQMDT